MNLDLVCQKILQIFFYEGLLCISTSERMVKKMKITKKHEKSINNLKKTTLQLSNHLLGVHQLLEVTPNRWQTNFFLNFSSRALHEPLVRMMKKVLFPWFLNVFHWACIRWSKYTTKVGSILTQSPKVSVKIKITFDVFTSKSWFWFENETKRKLCHTFKTTSPV